MGSPTLTSAQATQLYEAMATLASLQLPAGVTIAGDPFLQDDRVMVLIDDQNVVQSRVVTLASLTGSDNTHFNTPGVCRPLSAVAACSSEPSCLPEHDYSLDACYMPTPENLDKILRQRASLDDPVRTAEAALALKYAMDEAQKQGPDAVEALQDQINSAVQRVQDEHPGDYQRVAPIAEQYKQELVTPPPTSASPESFSSQDIASGTPDDGVVSPVFGPGVSLTSEQPSGFVETTVVTASVGDSVMPDSDELCPVDGESSVVVSYPASMPSASVTIASGSLQEWSGRSSISGYHSDLEFVRGLFSTGAAPWTSLLLDPSTSNRSELSEFRRDLRRGVAEAIWKYRSAVQWGQVLPDSSGSVTLGFHYQPSERRIVVALRPGRVDPHAPADVSEVLGILDGEETSPWATLRRFSTLAMARLGIDRPTSLSDTGSPLTPVYVPLPAQFWSGGRSLAEGIVGLLTHSDTATDRGILKTAHQGDLTDHQGRGQGGHQESDDQEPYAGPDEDEIDFPDSLGVDSSPWQHFQRKNAA